MNLNFVDPPIPAESEAVDLGIGADEIGKELEALAVWIETDELPTSVFQPHTIGDLAGALRHPEAARIYAESLPMVARFLTIELDVEIAGDNGIGRFPGEPPPRFGGRYRKQLSDAEARQALGHGLERLIFEGYAGGVALNAVLDEPATVVERPIEERWGPFMRSMAPSYHELTRGIDFEERPSVSIALLIAGQAIATYADLMQRFKLGRGLRPLSKSRAKSFALFFAGVGHALWISSTDLSQTAAEL